MVVKETRPPVICRLSKQALSDLVEIEAESNTPPWSEELFKAEFQNRVGIVYGARVGGKLVGFLVAHFILDEFHILNFGVRKDFRGNGIGRALISQVLREMHSESARWATLEVRKSNLIARGLYESLGFSETGIRERYYPDDNEDGVVMSLNIQQFVMEGDNEKAGSDGVY